MILGPGLEGHLESSAIGLRGRPIEKTGVLSSCGDPNIPSQKNLQNLRSSVDTGKGRLSIHFRVLAIVVMRRETNTFQNSKLYGTHKSNDLREDFFTWQADTYVCVDFEALL